MFMRKTIQLLLCASLAAFTGMAAQKNPTLSQVNSGQCLSQLADLEQKGRYAEVAIPVNAARLAHKSNWIVFRIDIL